MSNPSYCRFTHTLRDLGHCQVALEKLVLGLSGPLQGDELIAAQRLVETCFDIVALVCESTERDFPVDPATLALSRAVRRINAVAANS